MFFLISIKRNIDRLFCDDVDDVDIIGKITVTVVEIDSVDIYTSISKHFSNQCHLGFGFRVFAWYIYNVIVPLCDPMQCNVLHHHSLVMAYVSNGCINRGKWEIEGIHTIAGIFGWIRVNGRHHICILPNDP